MTAAAPKHDYPACAVFRGGKCTCDALDDLDAWRCETCDGRGRVDSSYTVHVLEHGKGAGEILTTECCDACEGLGFCGPDAVAKAGLLHGAPGDCDSCGGTGSGGMGIGCTDCLGTGIDPHAINQATGSAEREA